jgi:transposase
MVAAPWIVPDELWELVEPLLPKRERRFRYPARTRLKSEDVHDAAGCHGRVVREMDRVNRRATTELGSFALSLWLRLARRLRPDAAGRRLDALGTDSRVPRGLATL